jgi:hypothetical protein
MEDFTPAELSTIVDALLDRLAMLQATLQQDYRLQWRIQPKIDAADSLLRQIDNMMGQ